MFCAVLFRYWASGVTKQRTTMEWITFTDKLPEPKVPVLVVSDEGKMSVEVREDARSLVIYCHATDSGYATHWMPLPAAPLRSGPDPDEW